VTSTSFGVLGFPEGGKFVAFVVGDHGGFTGLPLGGADFAVFVSELEGFDQTENLIDVSADGEIVDGELTEHSLGVDDVGGSEGNTLILAALNEAAVVSGDRFGDVRNHGDVHGAKTTLSSGLLSVFGVGKVGVNGDTNNLGANGLELSSAVAELADLGGAHEGEVKGPEEEDNIFV